MSTTTQQAPIEFPADLIRDVRLGTILELHTAAERLHQAAAEYGMSDALKTPDPGLRKEYFDACDDLEGWLKVLGDIGDDIEVREPLNRVPPAHAARLCSAANWQANMLRSQVGDIGMPQSSLSGDELLALAQRIAKLEGFASALADSVPPTDNEEA
jgi:hypothetical protein